MLSGEVTSEDGAEEGDQEVDVAVSGHLVVVEVVDQLAPSRVVVVVGPVRPDQGLQRQSGVGHHSEEAVQSELTAGDAHRESGVLVSDGDAAQVEHANEHCLDEGLELVVGVVSHELVVPEDDPGEDEAEAAEELVHEHVGVQTVDSALGLVYVQRGNHQARDLGAQRRGTRAGGLLGPAVVDEREVPGDENSSQGSENLDD